MRATGFILQPTYRIEAGRPVVHLYGRLESGASFLVRDGREMPHFFVREKDAEKARKEGAGPLTPAGKVTLAAEPVSRVEVRVPAEAPPLRDRLTREGVACYEADVRFAMRYLIDRGIRGTVSIEGEGRPADGIGMVFEAPELQPADWSPRLSTLSFDIETDPEARRLLSIALHGCGAAEVHLLTARNRDRAYLIGIRSQGRQAEQVAAFDVQPAGLEADTHATMCYQRLEIVIEVRRSSRGHLQLKFRATEQIKYGQNAQL